MRRSRERCGGGWAIAAAMVAMGATMLALAGAGMAHEVKYPSTAVLTGVDSDAGDTLWSGQVDSEREKCLAGRTVRVFRMVDGPDEQQGPAATSEPDGSFVVDAPGYPPPDGSYYAKVKKRDIGRANHRHVCGAARSNTFEFVINPEDADGDGVNNSVDNCPSIANPSQEDADLDDKGDACDPCPNDANPGTQECPTASPDKGRKD